MHYGWLLNAGARFHYPGRPLHRIDCIEDFPNMCEVSPLVSYNGENLEKYVKGKTFEPPIVLDLDPETNQVTYNGLDLETYSKSYPTDILAIKNSESDCFF